MDSTPTQNDSVMALSTYVTFNLCAEKRRICHNRHTFCILLYSCLLFYFYRKLYKALRENTYRIDEDGISVSITTVDDIWARYLTTPFSLIKDIWLAQNYIYIEMEDKADIGVVYLFSDEPERILGNIVSYMQLEKKAKEDKSLPYYSAEEHTDLRNFVEERLRKDWRSTKRYRMAKVSRWTLLQFLPVRNTTTGRFAP